VSITDGGQVTTPLVRLTQLYFGSCSQNVGIMPTLQRSWFFISFPNIHPYAFLVKTVFLTSSNLTAGSRPAMVGFHNKIAYSPVFPIVPDLPRSRGTGRCAPQRVNRCADNPSASKFKLTARGCCAISDIGGLFQCGRH
jgi:hypothetical protein